MKISWKEFILWPAVIIGFFIVGKNVENSFLKNLAIVSAIGVEKEEDLYKVTIQVISPTASQKEATGDLGAVVYEQTGRTFSEAVRLASQKVSRYLFLDDTEVFIMDEELAKENGIKEAIDFLIMEPNVTSNLQVFISKGTKPGEILKIFTPIQKISARRIKEIARNIGSDLGTAVPVYPNKIKNYLLNQTTAQISIPYLQVEGDAGTGMKKANIEEFDPPAKIKIGGMAVFRNDKLEGFLDTEQSKILLLLEKKLERTLFEAGCPNGEKGFTSMNVSKYKPKFKPKVINGMPGFDISVKLDGEVIETSCSLDFTLPSNKEYEKVFTAELQKQIEELIEQSQEDNLDYIGFGKRLYTRKPQLWSEIEKKWESVYPDMRTNIEVEVVITEFGDVMKLR
ncbi:Ger(x)C family spore germination protein [Bacillus infantis]|uniref:Ger(X)C family spore germination protein n=1 Tax=Bacillus infantis TaxID=324767 RepID=A0A5D4RLE0_9BACI|nr:Ger(x)C family spore germination protein [Bacillus infantis]TYS52193.1 Ger(x)C family spore germination protein [Bacillus infantis]